VVGAGGHTRTIPVGGQPTGLAAGAGSVWVASTAAGTLTRVDPGRETVTATVRVGERPYAVAASPRAVWVAVLGQPVMMHAPAHAAAGSTLSWLLSLCG
jgi:YVTN family beta-propeller protein